MPVCLIGLIVFILPHVKSCFVCLVCVMPAGGGRVPLAGGKGTGTETWGQPAQGTCGGGQAGGNPHRADGSPQATCSDPGGLVVWKKRFSVALPEVLSLLFISGFHVDLFSLYFATA